jgi:AraC-like DNA-binding protein
LFDLARKRSTTFDAGGGKMRRVSVPYADKFTFSGDGVWLSEFRLLPSHPDWGRVRRTTDEVALIAFPRSSVGIRHERADEVIADASTAVLYSPGQAYSRRLISGRGDDCTILAVDRRLIARAAAPLDAHADGGSYRFPFAAAALTRDAYASIQRVRHTLQRPNALAPAAVQEELIWLVASVVSTGYRATTGFGATGGRRAKSAVTERNHRDVVADVREHIARDLHRQASLAELAQTVHTSPFHLARVFRAATGQSIHGYRTDLRLRASLTPIADGVRLADVAQQLGFASHAHLTDRFTRHFGVSPQAWRLSLATGTLRTNVEAKERTASIA